MESHEINNEIEMELFRMGSVSVEFVVNLVFHKNGRIELDINPVALLIDMILILSPSDCTFGSLKMIES